jgi:putative transposase
VSRKKLGSQNRKRANVKRARLHEHIRNIRQDALHKLTTHLSRNFYAIIIEDLNVKGMVSNRRLARAILDMGFHEFRRQLLYKSELRGSHVVLADRWFPSTKLCSRCSVMKNDMALGERVFRCHACDLEMDRDLNAAINLLRIVVDEDRTVSSTEYQACGEVSSGPYFHVGETRLEEAGTGT